MSGRLYTESELRHPDAWESEDGQRAVFIPDQKCCGRAPWNCECPSQCETEDDDGNRCTGTGRGARPLCDACLDKYDGGGE
jgi:hypothetical protein